MSAEHPSENPLEARRHAPPAHPGHPPAEEDVVPAWPIAKVGVVALIVFAIGSVGAGLGMVALRRELQPAGPPPTPGSAGQAKIGIVEQRLFELSTQGVSWKEHAERRLASTGWIDREAGIVHVPVDGAIERVVKGERP